MPKNPNHRSKPVKRDEPMTGSMKFFLAGCVAELYLLVVRRCYVNGNAQQQINWYDRYLLGIFLSAMWKADTKKREIGWYAAGGGAFLMVSALLIRALNAPVVTLLSVVVPVVMLLAILWSLYDRECAVALTVLGVSLIFLWVCRRMFPNIYYGTLMRVIAVLFLALLAAAASAAHLHCLRPFCRGCGGGAGQPQYRLLRHVDSGCGGLRPGGVLHRQAAVIS